jgi:branched-chain amino acid transport system permease protein
MFLLGVLLSALIVGVIGAAMEIILLRRIYHVPELFQLLATFGVVLIVQDLVIKLWGAVEIPGPRAPSLRHGVFIFDQRFPAYELFLIGVGLVVLGLLWLLMQKTRFGVLIRAATQDRDMVAALGVNQAWLFTGTLFLGAFLAGLGGALQIPRVAVNTQMDISIITEVFVVTVIGGMGSVPGAFVAALIIGQLQAFGILIFPKITLVLVFLLMAVVLVVKPWGLFGKPDAAAGRAILPEGILSLKRFGRVDTIIAGIAIAVLIGGFVLGKDTDPSLIANRLAELMEQVAPQLRQLNSLDAAGNPTSTTASPEVVKVISDIIAAARSGVAGAADDADGRGKIFAHTGRVEGTAAASTGIVLLLENVTFMKDEQKPRKSRLKSAV